MMRSIASACLIAALTATAHQAAAQPAKADMVDIPAGSFTMGNTNGPADEQPEHHVTLSAFSIDRYPVTSAQFAVFLHMLP